MKILTRILLALVFVLTCFVGAVLIVHVVLGVLPQGNNTQTHSTLVEATRIESPLSLMLTKLPLLPFSPFSQKKLVAVVIENNELARLYHRGLEDSLFIEEFLVEGLITRFVVLFDLDDLPPEMGPVRSLRPYFLDGISLFTNVILHAGGSPQAFDRVANDSTLIAINGLMYPKQFYRDEEIPPPHNLFVTRGAVHELVPADDVWEVHWPPYKTGISPTGSGASTITIDFHNPDHDVRYDYSALTHTYTRDNGGTISKAEPSNVLILEVPILGEWEQGRLNIDLKGSGDLLLFHSGKIFHGRWMKKDNESPLLFTDQHGNPLVFSRGQTWMTVMHLLERVEWK